MEHAQRAVARPPRRGGRAARRNRHGDVHASASRSSRLEHRSCATANGCRPSRTRVTCSRSSTSIISRRSMPIRRPRRPNSARSANAWCRWSRPAAPISSPDRTSSTSSSTSCRPAAIRPAISCSRSNFGGSTAMITGDVFHHLLQVYLSGLEFPEELGRQRGTRQPPPRIRGLRRDRRDGVSRPCRRAVCRLHRKRRHGFQAALLIRCANVSRSPRATRGPWPISDRRRCRYRPDRERRAHRHDDEFVQFRAPARSAAGVV